MSGFINVIQFYPAINKILMDINSYWSGQDSEHQKRITQHKLDSAIEEMNSIKQLIIKNADKKIILMRDASTQTEEYAFYKRKVIVDDNDLIVEDIEDL